MARLLTGLLKQPRLADFRRTAERYWGQIVLVLLVLYVVLFFWWPLGDWSPSQVKPERRFRFLGYLLLPEEIVELWFGEPPSFAFFDRLPYVALGVVVWGWSMCWGWIALDVLGILRYLRPAERAIFSAATGASLLSNFMLLAGIAGLLAYPAVFRLVVLLTFTVTGAIYGLRGFLGRGFKESTRESTSLSHVQKRKRDSPKGAIRNRGRYIPRAWPRPNWEAVAAGIFAALILLGAVLPPVEFDVREYHLQAPKEFFLAGRITFLPHNVYANMPLGAEMLPLAAMALAGDWWTGALAGKWAQAGFALLTAGALLTTGSRLGARPVGRAAAFIFLSTPWVVQLANLGLVEWAWSCYGLLAWFAWLLWLASPGLYPAGTNEAQFFRGAAGSAGSWSMLLLAGYLGGAACGCKYPAVLFIAVPLVILTAIVLFAPSWLSPLSSLFLTMEQKSVDRGENAASSQLSAGRSTSGKQKNRKERENPDFPAENARARVGTKAWLAVEIPWWYRTVLVGGFLAAMSAGGGLWYVKNAWLTGNPVYPLLGQYLDGKTRTPELITRWNRAHQPPGFSLRQLGRDFARVTVGSEWLSPIVWPCALLGWFLAPKWLRLGVALYTFWWFGLWWLATHRIDRFWLPILPLLALLGGYVQEVRSEFLQRALRIAIPILTVWNLFISTTIGGGYTAYFVPMEQLRTDPFRVPPWIMYLNSSADVRRLLLVGEAAVFDYQVPTLYNTCFDPCWIETLSQGRDLAQVRQALQEQGISHVLVHWGEINRYRSPGNYGYCSFVNEELFEQWERAELLERASLAWGDSVVLYRVRY